MAQLPGTFAIGRHVLQDGSPPLFLPEIGTFFNQDIDLALNMVERLHQAGATVIKGEILHRVDVCLDVETSTHYSTTEGGSVSERYRDLIGRKVVPLARYEKVFGKCRELGIEFIVSVYDFEGADFAKCCGASALKIASANVVHQPLIEYVAGLGLPMLIDTGGSTLEEAARAVSWARDVGADRIVIQHSPDPPPAPVAEHNLLFMVTLGRALGLPYGLSDHHRGVEMLFAAIALGAVLVEKGVVPDTSIPDQDVGHAMLLSEVSAVMAQCANIHTGLGNGARHLPRQRRKKLSRMGLIARRNVSAGDSVGGDTAEFAFPALGIPVEYWSEVRGWRLRRPVQQGQPITWGDVEPVAS